jgi:hypothetical protein
MLLESSGSTGGHGGVHRAGGLKEGRWRQQMRGEDSAGELRGQLPKGGVQIECDPSATTGPCCPNPRLAIARQSMAPSTASRCCRNRTSRCRRRRSNLFHAQTFKHAPNAKPQRGARGKEPNGNHPVRSGDAFAQRPFGRLQVGSPPFSQVDEQRGMG